MLQIFQGQAGDSKLRLFVWAACDSPSMDSDIGLAGIGFYDGLRAVAERSADGLASEAELAEAGRYAWETEDRSYQWERWGIRLIWTAAGGDLKEAIEGVREAYRRWDRQDDKDQMVRLLRDIFGNPFRPVTLDPVWLTPTVRSLAQVICDERAFDRMPVLADALEDAGCTDPRSWSTAGGRGRGPHVRGCWVIDLLTGRT
jgi:hypothetical protein